MPEWEYRAINLSDLPRETTDLDLLDEAGEDGWELVAITPKLLAYLKRDIRQLSRRSASRSAGESVKKR